MTDPATLRDPDAERAVLGALVLESEDTRAALARDGVTLSPGDYSREAHATIHTAIMALAERGDAVDHLSVGVELGRQTGRPAESFVAEIVDLLAVAVPPSSAPTHARRVVELARRRELRLAGLDLVERAQDPGVEIADLAREHVTSIEALRAGRRDRRSARIVTLDELCDLPPAQWIVRGLVPAASVGFLVGPPNSGKSLVALDWALRITRGETWIDGRGIRSGAVVYALGEGASGFGQRVRAWEREHGGPAHRERFAVVRGLPALSSPSGISELRSIVAEHADAHGAVAFIVIDTLATHWSESEDKSEHVGPCMRALADLGAEYACSVLLIHHPRKPQAGAKDDPWAASRGSGAWIGAADYALSLAPGTGDVVTLAVSKMRDGDRGPSVALRIMGVDLGTVDEEGRPITGPILVPAEDEPQEDAEAARRAEHEQRIRAVVETVVRKGPAAKDRIVRETTGKAALLRDAVDDAEKRGLLVPFKVKTPGQRARTHYRIGSDPSPDCAAHTLSDSPSGTGRVDPVPALTVPSGPGRHGTGRDGQGRGAT